MAIDICSEISISPRISFSHDLNQLDQNQNQNQNFDRILNSVSDFDFCVNIKNDKNFTFEISSADELFSNGKILPVQIKTTTTTTTKKKIIQLKDFLSSSYDTDEEEQEQENDKKPKPTSNYMSFWKFRRSNSLNLDKIKSLHFISRSNSTGSTQSTARNSNNKISNNIKPSLKKQQSAKYPKSISDNSSNYSYKRSSSYPRKSNSNSNSGGSQIYYGNYSNSNSNGIRVSPVLNISKVTISFFGFGSLFCNGKLRNKKK